MNRLVAFCGVLTLIVVSGCRRPPVQDTIVLLDVSRSITAEGIRYEFETTNSLVDRMHRGDHLVIIPITGSAISETTGHILGLDAPRSREAYDADLANFRKAAHGRLRELQGYYAQHPTNKTDIIGTLEMAAEQLADDGNKSFSTRQVWVFTDFLEDDGAYTFVSDPILSAENDARSLAGSLRISRPLALEETTLHLCVIESDDLRDAPPQRQRAVRAFWAAYFTNSASFSCR